MYSKILSLASALFPLEYWSGLPFSSPDFLARIGQLLLRCLLKLFFSLQLKFFKSPDLPIFMFHVHEWSLDISS